MRHLHPNKAMVKNNISDLRGCECVCVYEQKIHTMVSSYLEPNRARNTPSAALSLRSLGSTRWLRSFCDFLLDEAGAI